MYHGASVIFMVTFESTSTTPSADNIVSMISWYDMYPLNLKFLQYSSKGTVAGIAGNVDLNYSYKNYPEIIQKNNLNGTGSVDVLFNDIRPVDAAKVIKWAQENGLKATQYDGRRF